MKCGREVRFLCDNCKKNITDKRHIRILIGCNSGWMEKPFIGGIPKEAMVDRNPEFHFCQTECLASFFTSKLNEVRTDTRINAYRNRVAPISWAMLEKTGLAGPRVHGTYHMGTRDQVQWEKSKRGLGHSDVMLLVSPGGGNGKDDQRVDRFESNDEERRKEIPKVRLGTKTGIFKRIIRAFTPAKING